MKNPKKPSHNGDAAGHAEFRRWVYSLTRSQLLNAMEFSVYVDSSSGVSHEYELFLEMITLQPPPFCPIHPRAVPYPVASGKAKTDGRNTAVKMLKSRIQQPRIFQFLATSNSANNNINNNNNNGRRRNGQRKRTAPVEQRFEVIARKFITSWGDALNIGCTQEQRMADEQIMRGTLVVHAAMDGCVLNE
ncbi:expressed unknown protein [Seminavis robusta]|uniref:Uncharacterized protein n=1 Tax=Seminavis robusta TaxID=568900 RepID=A0A9N8EZL4_9STRA|nr:expressed unknown protein [Seminavis robusta]|eukprot:Sro2619_g332820.1 n/a (190) ;mRNA; r:268-837